MQRGSRAASATSSSIARLKNGVLSGHNQGSPSMATSKVTTRTKLWPRYFGEALTVANDDRHERAFCRPRSGGSTRPMCRGALDDDGGDEIVDAAAQRTDLDTKAASGDVHLYGLGWYISSSKRVNTILEVSADRKDFAPGAGWASRLRRRIGVRGAHSQNPSSLHVTDKEEADGRTSSVVHLVRVLQAVVQAKSAAATSKASNGLQQDVYNGKDMNWARKLGLDLPKKGASRTLLKQALLQFLCSKPRILRQKSNTFREDAAPSDSKSSDLVVSALNGVPRSNQARKVAASDDLEGPFGVEVPLKPQLGSDFDHALVVHRGKRGLEQVRPNPYVGELLPTVLYHRLQSSRQTIPLDTAFETALARVEEEVEMMGLEGLREHEEWGSPAFVLQWSLETRAVELGVASYNRLRKEAEARGDGSSLGPAQRIMVGWFEQLMQAIKREQENYIKVPAFRDFQQLNKGKGIKPAEMGQRYQELKAQLEEQQENCFKVTREVYGPVFLTLSAEKLAVIVMHEVMGNLLTRPEGAKFLSTSLMVGRAVEAEINLLRAKEDRIDLPSRQLTKALNERNPRLVNQIIKRVAPTTAWNDPLRAQVGAALIAVLLDTCVLKPPPSAPSTRVPAFEHSRVRTVKRGVCRDLGVIRARPALQELIDQGHDFAATLNPTLLPMVVKPLRWQSPTLGCYLRSPGHVMRTHGDRTQESLCTTGNLTRVFSALDVLSATQWSINQRVLAVVQKAWKDDLVLADLPQQEDHDLPDLVDEAAAAEDPELEALIRVARRERRRLRQQNADLHSLRCDMINKLHVATEMARHPGFYFPHSIDFRGRAYPIPPHLNHLGSDLCRGLLKFAEGRPLGQRGLFWLKVHLANLFGVNKLSFTDRAAWTDARLKLVYAAARDPLHPKHRAFWLEAEEPWQALATCIELRDAMASPRPEAFVSSLPVHQDGSCNGLQHYAALGLDEIGGAQVNLVPGVKPSDPYTTVCNRVIDMVNADAADPASPNHAVALLARGRIGRKIVKQTVMTTVYGVTFIGARDQIKNRLRETYGDTGSKEMTEDEVYECAGYLARQTLSGVGDIFVGARRTMDWLSATARTVARTGRAVQWETPLGLPVIQPYRKYQDHAVRTVVQEVRLSRTEGLPINRQKQKTAFPPNFVHSLDSTHLMMTALDFNRRGCVFAGVHDSFWTHAADVEVLGRVLREQFVELYSAPILERLKTSLETDYAVALPPLPPKGRLDLQVVKQSPYFFS